MKITVNVEATPQEMREFLGLPNVQPLQDEIMNKLLENMQRGIPLNGVDMATMMKPLLPAHLQSMEVVQKAFWDAFLKQQKNPDRDNNPSNS